MLLIKKGEGGLSCVECRESSPGALKTLSTALAQKIIKALSEKDFYPKELAKKFNIHEQKIYYHIRKLEKAEIIKKTKTENINGVLANYYTLSSPAFAIALKEFYPYKKEMCAEENDKFFHPFIENGILNAIIITGSQTTHGRYHSRSRDIRPTSELILLLGTYFSQIPDQKSIKFDTEITDKDLKRNLILVGGPIANIITEKINKYLPIRFVGKKIFSSCSKKTYSHDETGFIVKTKNPFNKKAQVLILAGNTGLGTKASITAIYKNLKEISEGNLHKPSVIAKVIEGIAADTSSEIENVKILE